MTPTTCIYCKHEGRETLLVPYAWSHGCPVHNQDLVAQLAEQQRRQAQAAERRAA